MSADNNPMLNPKGQQRWRLWQRLPWFRKRDEAVENDEPDAPNAKVASAPPRNPGRRVFGFLCDPDLSNAVRILAAELAIPIYPVMEHAVDLGCFQIAQDLRDPASRQALHTHLVEEHFLKPNFNVHNPYDMNTAIMMRKAQLRQWELDRLAHEIARIIDRERIPHQVLVMTIEKLISDVRRRRNAQAAARFGQRRGYQPRKAAATVGGSRKDE